MIDDELRPALTAVKARSAHQRRARRAWAGAGCAVLIGAGGIGVARATSTGPAATTQDTAAGTTADGERDGGGGGGVAVDDGAATAVDEPSTTTTDTTPGGTATSSTPDPTTTAPAPPPGPTTTQPASTPAPPPASPPAPPRGPTTTTTVVTPIEPPPGTPTPLAEAKALWAAKGPASYEMTLQRLCFCASIEPMRVTVIDGVVQSGGDGAVTIDEIFDQASSLGAGGSITELRVNRSTGVPTIVAIDFVAMLADDEVTYIITDFVAIASEET